jgi:hypothetical protein
MPALLLSIRSSRWLGGRDSPAWSAMPYLGSAGTGVYGSRLTRAQGDQTLVKKLGFQPGKVLRFFDLR